VTGLAAVRLAAVALVWQCVQVTAVEGEEDVQAPIDFKPSHFAHCQSEPFEPVDPPGEQLLQIIAAWEFQEAATAWNLQLLLPAIKLFGRSAQKGYEVGEYCFRWGHYHELPPADIQQAIRWYARGARMNHMGCTTMLGKIHLALGHRSKAEDWLSRTAQPHSFGGTYGDSLAQWFLAEMNFQGGALRKAVRWWKRSAENGDVDAMMRLAQVFSEGHPAGIPQETMRASHWFLSAAAHGHPGALSKVQFGDLITRSVVEERWVHNMQERGWL